MIEEYKNKVFLCSIEQHNAFVEGVKWASDESDKNFEEDFNKLSKKWGIAYLSFLEASYLSKDSMSDEDFCKMNGNVPISFIEKHLI